MIKQAIVTGTSAGIGRSIAKAFAAAGARVACIARRRSDLDTLISEIENLGGRAFALDIDVAQPGAATQIVSDVEQKFGPVDILINNAGISRISPLVTEDPSVDLWWRVYEVNVRAPVALVRAVLPSMIERGGGVVISTSSQVAAMDLPVMTAYASSKAAISKFHESLVPELEGTGILSFAVNPGMVATELGKAEGAINRAAIDHPAMQAFLGMVRGDRKLQSPESCANLMLALAADERCKVLTGRHLNADQEFAQVLVEAEKVDRGRLGKERLYLVNIGEL
jgi:NAD(P)-dependent dehydrogenase (short-subunit alcohol dehydrogenase family)